MIWPEHGAVDYVEGHMISKPVATALVDAAAAIVLLVASRYLGAADAQFVRELVVIVQAPLVLLIGGMFYADAKAAETAVKLQGLALAHQRSLTAVKAEHKALVKQ